MVVFLGFPAFLCSLSARNTEPLVRIRQEGRSVRRVEPPAFPSYPLEAVGGGCFWAYALFWMISFRSFHKKSAMTHAHGEVPEYLAGKYNPYILLTVSLQCHKMPGSAH